MFEAEIVLDGKVILVGVFAMSDNKARVIVEKACNCRILRLSRTSGTFAGRVINYSNKAN